VPKTLDRKLVSAVAIFVVLLGGAIPAVRDQVAGQWIDFHTFYRAAHAFANGGNIYTATHGLYVYPPLLAFLLQPLLLFHEREAAFIWMFLSGAIMVIAAAISAKDATRHWQFESNAALPWVVTAVSCIFAADLIGAVFHLGQNDALLLLAFAGMVSCMERKPFAAGIAAGFGAHIRYLTLIFFPYFLLKRNYRAAEACVVSFVLLAILPALETGLAPMINNTRDAAGVIGHYGTTAPTNAGMSMNNVTWYRSVSLTSAVFRMTRAHHLSDAGAIAIIAALFIAIMAIIVLIARGGGMSIFTRAQSATPAPMAQLESAVLIFLTMVFSPHTTTRHMVLLLLLFPLAIVLFLRQTQSWPRLLVASATMLMILAVSFPPAGVGFEWRLFQWRIYGGASWCATIFILVMVWIGCRSAR
jgi:hypothetical protein